MEKAVYNTNEKEQRVKWLKYHDCNQYDKFVFILRSGT